MKKPVILRSDVVVVGATIAVSTVAMTIGAFAAYRYGRKVEISLINILKKISTVKLWNTTISTT